MMPIDRHEATAMSATSTVPLLHHGLPSAELTALHAALAVDDAKIPRLLKIVDQVQQRGAIDDLIAPFRGRMAQLRPPRPLRFRRLLFTPLDPLIVPPGAWRPKAPTLPRSAMAPLEEAIRPIMGEDAERIDRMIEGRTTHDRATVAEAGPLLWSGAAQALMRCPTPEGWTEKTGLPDGLFSALATGTGTVLGQVLTLQTWRAEAEIGEPVRTSAATRMLLEVNRAQPQAVGMMIALVLARLPQAARSIRKAIGEIGGSLCLTMREAMETAIGSLLDRLEAEKGVEAVVLGTPLRQAATEAYRVLALLACANVEDAKPALRRRLTELRRRLDESCRLRFTVGLQRDFLQILEDPDASGNAREVAGLEDAARGLSDLAEAARRVGSGGTYDALLRQTTDVIKAIGSNGQFTLADKARLIEILAGPDDAWALLKDTAPEPPPGG